MKKLLLAVFLLLPAAVCVQAQQNPLYPNWGWGDVTGQHRTVTDNSNVNKPLTIVGAGSRNGGSVTNSSLTIDGSTGASVSITNATTAEEAYTNKTAYVAGGATFNNTAKENALNLSNLTLEGRDAFGGAALQQYASDRFGSGAANANVVNLTNVTTQAHSFTPTGTTTAINLGGNVYGGYSEYAKGTANGNTVTIGGGSTINGNVYGGRIKDSLSVEDLKVEGVLDSFANNNTVIVKDSTVNGTVAGAAGASTSNGNTVWVENSTVTSVYGVDQSRGIEDSDSSVTYANNNTVTIQNSTVTNAAAVKTTSINASGNTLNLIDSVLGTGSVYAVNMGLTTAAASGEPVKAEVGSNSLNLTRMTGTFNEMGSTLNLVGTANGNTLSIKDSNLTLNNTTGKFFGDTLDVAGLTSQNLLKDLPADKGVMFGGASMTYTSQTGSNLEEEPEAEKVAVSGTNSDGNTLTFSGGSLDANVLGGFAAYINEINYSTKDENGVITTVKKDGLIITATSSDPSAEPEEPETVEQIDDKYSASNNTIVLDGVNFKGTLYGGYVYGAELKEENMLTQNNTVILRGDVTLDASSVLYGGSNGYYTHTNKLVFDRTRATFANKNQFQNFNNLWTINANFETDLNFNFDGVYANMTLDKSAMKEGAAAVVTTQTAVDLSNIQQGEKVYDLTDSGVVLTQKKIGVYSYDLTGVRGAGANEVDWILTGKKDTANAEVYGQLPLVGLALATEGPEMLSHTMGDAWQNENDASTFLNGGYHHTRYETGSGFDLDSGVFQAGAWKKFTSDWMGGIFAKYGTGSYDTYPIKVSGEADVYAGGLMTSYRYSETGRLEANVQVGYMDMDFNSGDLVSSFKSKGVYYGANVGFVENLFQNLDLFANVNYLRKNKDDITDNLDQKIKFDAMQSLALRFGADYVFNSVDLFGLVPSVGASGIYEFDGKSKVTAEGVKSDEASMKGMSGRGQIGLTYVSYDTYMPLRTALTVFGQAGKRERWGAEANNSFEF